MWLLRYGNVERNFQKCCGGHWLQSCTCRTAEGNSFLRAGTRYFRFPPKGKWEKFLLLCFPTVFLTNLERNSSEPKSLLVVLLEFIVVYANRALQAHLTADQ